MFILYLDPGSGSILLQLLIAALAGIGIFIGSRWAKIKKLFGRRQQKNPPDDENDDA